MSIVELKIIVQLQGYLLLHFSMPHILLVIMPLPKFDGETSGVTQMAESTSAGHTQHPSKRKFFAEVAIGS